MRPVSEIKAEGEPAGNNRGGLGGGNDRTVVFVFIGSHLTPNASSRPATAFSSNLVRRHHRHFGSAIFLGHCGIDKKYLRSSVLILRGVPLWQGINNNQPMTGTLGR